MPVLSRPFKLKDRSSIMLHLQRQQKRRAIAVARQKEYNRNAATLRRSKKKKKNYVLAQRGLIGVGFECDLEGKTAAIGGSGEYVPNTGTSHFVPATHVSCSFVQDDTTSTYAGTAAFKLVKGVPAFVAEKRVDLFAG